MNIKNWLKDLSDDNKEIVWKVIKILKNDYDLSISLPFLLSYDKYRLHNIANSKTKDILFKLAQLRVIAYTSRRPPAIARIYEPTPEEFNDPLIEVLKPKLLNKLFLTLDKQFNDIKKVKKLIFYGGMVTYVNLENKEFETRFKINSNSYLLLRFLAENSGKLFSVTELIGIIKKPRAHAIDSIYEKRIRDTIQDVRDKFGIDFFIVSGKLFGIVKCDVNIKSSNYPQTSAK